MILNAYLEFIILNSFVMLIGFGLEWLFGWPAWLYRHIGHPVSWLGSLISWLDRVLNRPEYPASLRYAGGIACLFTVAGISATAGAGLMLILPLSVLGICLAGLFSFPMLASKSLAQHVQAVATPLQKDDIEAAREAVGMIVGRDVSTLDEAGISRAAIESLAENTSDGIVAPLFWGVLAGLPGLYLYKAVNTLDSMIGYKTDKHGAFGWASARFDDLVNLLPARLCGLLFCLTSQNRLNSIGQMWAEAGQHRSPNAGWPESAVASSLEIQLSGPRIYHDHVTTDAIINPSGRIARKEDIGRALARFRQVMILICILLIVTASGAALI